MVKKILQKDERVLRMVAKEIPVKEIRTVKIKKILKEMSSALRSQSDGVAIAAPQIGYSLRIFVVSGKVFSGEFTKTTEEKGLEKEIEIEKNKTPKDLIFINPKIIKLSRKKDWVPEGCLSVRPFYGKTFRSEKATITAYDENGKKFTRGGAGLLAQIFQHETDHLNGILFIDHAKEISAEAPEKYYEKK